MTTRRRILVGAGSFADARAALRLAREALGQPGAEIGGMLVEEAVLSDLPRTAGQRVVTITGGLIETPSHIEARAALERDARAFAQALSEFAGLAAPLARGRGDLALSIWEAAEGWDVVVVGQRTIHALPGRVVLIAPPAGAGSGAATLAADLARSLGCATVTLGLGAGEAEGGEWFAAEEALLARLARISCAAVVLDRAAGPFHGADEVRRLLAAAQCPVVVLAGPPAP